MARAGFGGAMLATVLATGLAAQEFQPPRTEPPAGTRIGLFGFGVRGGVELGDPTQLVGGVAFDVGNLFSDRFRLRAAGEVGLDGVDSFVAALEGLFRFTRDIEPTVPYIGVGAGVAGHDGCGRDPGCPAVWITMVIGFERRFRSTFNWLFEYHALDALRRHRFHLGLVTRRGG